MMDHEAIRHYKEEKRTQAEKVAQEAERKRQALLTADAIKHGD